MVSKTRRAASDNIGFLARYGERMSGKGNGKNVIEMIDGLPAHESTGRRLIEHFNLDGARQKFVLH